jgi:hypothetical protein
MGKFFHAIPRLSIMKTFFTLALFASTFSTTTYCSKPSEKAKKEKSTDLSFVNTFVPSFSKKIEDLSVKLKAAETASFLTLRRIEEAVSVDYLKDPVLTLSEVLEKNSILDVRVASMIKSLRMKHSDFDQKFISFLQGLTKADYGKLRGPVIDEILPTIGSLDKYWERPADMKDTDLDLSAQIIAAILKKSDSEAVLTLMKGAIGKSVGGESSHLFGHFCVRSSAPIATFSDHLSEFARRNEGREVVHSFISSLIYSNKPEVREARRLFMSGRMEQIDLNLVFTEDQQRNNFILLQVLPKMLDSSVFFNLQVMQESKMTNKSKKPTAALPENDVNEFIAQGIALTHLLKFYDPTHEQSSTVDDKSLTTFVKLMKWLMRRDQSCAQSVMRQIKQDKRIHDSLIQFADAQIMNLMADNAKKNVVEKEVVAEKKVKVAKVKSSLQAKKKISITEPAPSQPIISSDLQIESVEASFSLPEPVHLHPSFLQDTQISAQDRTRLLQFQTDFLQATKDLIENEDRKVQSRILLYLIKYAKDFKFVLNTFFSQGYCLFESQPTMKMGADVKLCKSIFEDFSDYEN